MDWRKIINACIKLQLGAKNNIIFDASSAYFATAKSAISYYYNFSFPGTTYIYTVKDAEGQEYSVIRHYFPYWADHQAIGAETLEQLVDQLGTNRSVVHCRAGVGRSGTFAMANFIKDAVANGEITKANVKDKLNEMIIHGRTQRGMAFVQQDVQLNLLIRYTLKLLEDKTNQHS